MKYLFLVLQMLQLEQNFSQEVCYYSVNHMFSDEFFWEICLTRVKIWFQTFKWNLMPNLWKIGWNTKWQYPSVQNQSNFQEFPHFCTGQVFWPHFWVKILKIVENEDFTAFHRNPQVKIRFQTFKCNTNFIKSWELIPN